RPFFLWVHYMDPHGPYVAPVPFLERSEKATVAEDRWLPVNPDNRGLGGIPKYQYFENCHWSRDYLVRHNAAIASLDQALGRLLAEPGISRLRQEGLICLTADHGEALGEHNTWFAHS